MLPVSFFAGQELGAIRAMSEREPGVVRRLLFAGFAEGMPLSFTSVVAYTAHYLSRGTLFPMKSSRVLSAPPWRASSISEPRIFTSMGTKEQSFTNKK
jgi:hypothetical protein